MNGLLEQRGRGPINFEKIPTFLALSNLPVVRMSTKKDEGFVRAAKDITAGSVGGIAQVLTGQPFDIVKVLPTISPDSPFLPARFPPPLRRFITD
jgi:hypothetical protein